MWTRNKWAGGVRQAGGNLWGSTVAQLHLCFLLSARDISISLTYWDPAPPYKQLQLEKEVKNVTKTSW